MLLNQRQLEILLELFEKPEVYMTASYFSSKHQCSLHTIQNDIRQIKTELESTNCVIMAKYIKSESLEKDVIIDNSISHVAYDDKDCAS